MSRASSRPHTWLRHVTALPATCHGNYIPRDSIQLDETLPKKFALALFTGLDMATLFLILWPCQDFWLDFIWKPCDDWKRSKRGIWFLQEERAQICVSFSVPSLVVWAYEEMLVILFLFLIPPNTNILVLGGNAANEVFWLRNKAKRAWSASSRTGL